MERKNVFRQSYRLMWANKRLPLLMFLWFGGLLLLRFCAGEWPIIVVSLLTVPLLFGLMSMAFHVWQGKPIQWEQAWLYYTGGRLGRSYFYALVLGLLFIGLVALTFLFYLLLVPLVESRSLLLQLGVLILPSYLACVYTLMAMAFLYIYFYNWAYTAGKALSLAWSVIVKEFRTLLAAGWSIIWRLGVFSVVPLGLVAAIVKGLGDLLHPDDVLALCMLVLALYEAFIYTYMMLVTGGLWQMLFEKHLHLEENEDDKLLQDGWFA